MSKLTTRSSLVACTFAAALLGAGQAVAHTGIRDQGKENTTLYTGMVITHGCAGGEGETPIPVRAQSALFPNNADSIWTRLDTGAATTLEETIQGSVFALSPNLIQDRNVFKFAKEIADNGTLVGAHSVPNVRAFVLRKGKLRTDLQGVVPFSATMPSFVTTSCVKSLKVRIAISNWCSKSQTDGNRVDVWIGHTTTLFNDPGVVSTGFWPTLTVNRDLEKNPLPADCATNADGSKGYDVAVEPSSADIDNYLPLQGLWPTP